MKKMILFVSLLAVVGCSTKSHYEDTNHSVLHGSVIIHQSEKWAGTWDGGRETKNLTWTVEILQPGDYMIDAWASCYRAADKNVWTGTYHVDTVPASVSLPVGKVYRLEVTKHDANGLCKESVFLHYVGCQN